MDSSTLYTENTSLKRQRTMLSAGVIVATLAAIFMWIISFSKDREVVLVPVIEEELKLNSSVITQNYMEMLTRDTAVLILNRAPDSMDYWLKVVMRIVDPSVHGKIKSELYEIVEDQGGSSVSQFFVMKNMTVNTKTLVSEVKGTLISSVGSQRVQSVERTFRFKWKKRGVGVRLIGFEIVRPDGVRDQ